MVKVRWNVFALGAVPSPLSVAFHPSGQIFATGGREGFRLWDTAGNGLRLSAAHEGPIHALVFSPDGRLFLTGGQSPRAQLWETATGRPACPPFRHDGWVGAVAFSPDGRTALTGDERHKARPWDVVTGKPLGPPLPRGGMVGAVAFQADGRRFFTGSTDGAVRFWDLPQPWAGAPDRVRREVEVLTGMELDERGTARRLSADDLHQRRRGLPEPGGPQAP